MSDEIDDTVSQWRLRAESAEAALDAARIEADAKLIRAELKAEAVRAGMVDLDGLKLLDLASVRLGADGGVVDGAAILANLKRAKPWLFGGGSSSSAAVHAPRPEPVRVRHANELSHEEWLAARAALVRRR